MHRAHFYKFRVQNSFSGLPPECDFFKEIINIKVYAFINTITIQDNKLKSQSCIASYGVLVFFFHCNIGQKAMEPPQSKR